MALIEEIARHPLDGYRAGGLLRADGHLHFGFRPENVLGALWLHFAEWVDSGSEMRSCAQCATWFSVAGTGRRPETQYCSGACRQKAYRRRNQN